MRMVNISQMRLFSFLLSFYEYPDSNTLLYIKNVLILCPIRCSFFFLCIAVQINYINIIETLHQALAHPAKGRVIQVAVISNKSEDTIACLFDAPLSKADKFHIVIIKPFRIAFSQRLTINLKIIAHFL